MQAEFAKILSYNDLLGSCFQEEIFKCPSCKEYYDLELRVPKVLPCQHYLCLQCLKTSLLLQPIQEPQCPSCKTSFSSTTKPPEAFPTNPSILAILQNKEKAKLIYCQEHGRKRALFCITDQVPICKDCGDSENHKGHHIQRIKILQKKTNNKKKQLKELLQSNVQKKQEAEQEISEKLPKIQELITNQFFEMRKILHLRQAEISQNIDTALKAESENLMNTYNQNITILEGKIAEISQGEYDFITTEEPDNYDNYLPCDGRSNKLEKMLTETQETLSRFLKAVESLKFESTQTNEVSTQTVEEASNALLEVPILRRFSEENKKPMILQEEALSQVETNTFKEMEEEFEEADQNFGSNELTEKSIQDMKNQIIMEIEAEPQLKLDFSNKCILDEALSTLYSEEFWNRTEKNKISHLEVNFSASSLTDQQFVRFVQNVLTPLENIISIMINLAQTKVSSEGLQALSRGLKSCKLKHFVLNCSGTLIGNQGIKHLEDGLGSSIQTLEKIEIILDSTDIQGEKFLDVLFGMEQLKNLKLSFENATISSEIVSSVVFCLRFLAQNLENLDLNFNGTEINDEDLESFLNHAIFDVEKFKHFKLGLGGILVSDDLLLNFFQSLSSLAPRLVTFDLDLHSTKLTNEVFGHFCEGALNKMVNLENLKLDLSQTKIDDVSLINMRLPVRKLKYLTLNMSKTSLSDLGLKTFKGNNSFKTIENSNFSFEQTGISHKALQDFLSHLKNDSKDLHFNSTLKKIPPKTNLKIKHFSSASEASSEYSSDVENRPDLNEDFKSANKTEAIALLKDSVKRQILYQLKKAVLVEHGHKGDPARLDRSRFSHLIQNLQLETYDRILRKVLNKNLSNPESIPKDLDQWRKRIQMWIRCPKNRVSCEKVFSTYWLQKYSQEISLQQKAIEILKSMSIRSFSLFYEKLFEFVKKESRKYKNWEMPSEPRNSWFYNFMYKEKEVADAWKSLPHPHQCSKEEDN